MVVNTDFSPYILRRDKLVKDVFAAYPNTSGESIIVLFGGFENERHMFRQESSFFYYTGLEEPGVVITINSQGETILWKPHCGTSRAAWLYSAIELENNNMQRLGISDIRVLGQQCPGYQFHPFFPREEYQEFLAYLKGKVDSGASIFTLNPNNAYAYAEQRLILDRIDQFIPGFKKHITDISSLVHAARRTKEKYEIELVYKAIEITGLAQEAAARAIGSGVTEAQVQASIEYIFTTSQACTAFPSIVAGGKNSTILHYLVNKDVLTEGSLVVVDIGASYNYYAADLTRTYPVSGTFNKRQKELYNLVLETQDYIAKIAKPGHWLSNKEHPDQSLHHLAQAYLRERGYDRYFIHGIGHFLGIDVHDVGDYNEPLKKGDVFTIEPGIYIPEEQIGIRIEDDYWMVDDGAICLSENLPKTVQEIEEMVQQQFQ